jgi:hypothetical protein
MNTGPSKKYISLIISLIITIFISSCESNKESPNINSKPKFVLDSIFQKRRIAIDSFVNSLSNHNRPKKLPTDTVDFREICDTFYVSKEMREKVYILNQYRPGYYSPFYRKHICIESLYYGRMRETLLPSFIINFPIQFSHSTFYFNVHYPTLHGIIFKSFVVFENNIFPDSTIMQDIEFEDKVVFYDSSRNCQIPKFYYCKFLKGIAFNHYQINDFGGPFIKSYAFLAGCNLHSDVIFVDCKISGTLSFRDCKFEDNSSIRMISTFLPDTLDFTNVKISGKINLTNISAKKDKKCYINLLNADIEKFIFQYNHYKLFFPKKDFKTDESKDIISSIYERLLNNFKMNGFIESFVKLDIEYYEWKSKSNWLYNISNIWWKFGYQKWRIILFSIGFVFVFSFFNYMNYNLLQKVYPVKKLNWESFQYSSIPLIKFFRKFSIVFIYTGLIFFRLSIDFKNINFKPLRYAALIIFQYLIGLGCTGFLVNWILNG